MVTIVYAYNTKEERRGLRYYLEATKQGINEPWIIMGDFNSILNMDDRVGGNQVTVNEVVEFQQCVDACGIVKLPPKGSKYTWCDRHGSSMVFSKIDWVFVNDKWLYQMLDFVAVHLPEGIGDHCSVKIEQIENERHVSKPFKYCNAWENHPDFLPRVEAIWQEQIEGCIMLQVVKKLKLLKQSLKELNRQHFRNILTEVA
ncbi:uncharacterized protein LOC142167005 [Nicotiana tabacum]|uniref:Uncharacterized protein LOC142167005 n=1 Tax=Nicotiana tabacum TaxID=4097 RepID=A0AC58SE59_TOBAC